MTVAEIFGKISSTGSNLSERMEDLLTSDVFGPLRYIPFNEGIKVILEPAVGYESNQNLVINKSDSVEVFFWKKLTYSEPDVVVITHDAIIFIEAKYYSGKSGHFDAGSESEKIEAAASMDQLYREFMDLVNYSLEKSNRYLVYLTANRLMPQKDIKAGGDAVKVMDKNQEILDEKQHELYKKSIYWLSWFAIHTVINTLWSKEKDKHKKIIYQDIKELLYRKGFRFFEGYNKIFYSVKKVNKPIFYIKSAHDELKVTQKYFEKIPFVTGIKKDSFLFYQRVQEKR